ncbi:MAG: hypothetical protein J2P25_04370 [Nocardiopsaceae bacterium]|nr:hypothetical protein [Nocardiopsaceae bacterium]
MRKEWLRRWWPLGAVIVITAGGVVLLYLLFRSPHRTDQATYWAVPLAVVAIVDSWLVRAWQKGKTWSSGAVSGAMLDDAVDQLASAVRKQWGEAAKDRGLTGAAPILVTWGPPSRAMAGPASAAARNREFDPLPGLTATGETELVSGAISDLHALYGGLGSGKLIIAGQPGSGKSSAAVLLVLAALKHRDAVSDAERKLVPIPVVLTVQGWDPKRQKVKDWLAGELQRTYPLFAGARGTATVGALLNAGRITVILDGLDEIDPDLRPVVLRALNQQATFRLILLSRTGEIASATDQEVLHGAAAIELNRVDAFSAASFLEQFPRDPLPPAWRELIARIRADPDDPLSHALSTPLALTLVRDTYQAEDDVRELLDFCDALPDGSPASETAEAITDHLLDRVLPAAYADRPGQPLPYDLPTAERFLRRIAAQMNQAGTRDLNWWQIPEWAPSAPRRFVVGLWYGLAVGLAVGLWLGNWLGLASGIGYGIVAGGVVVFMEMTFVDGVPNRPIVMGDIRLKKILARKNLVGTLVLGLVLGLAGGVVFVIVPGAGLGIRPLGVVSELRNGFEVSLMVGPGFGLAAVLETVLNNLSETEPDSSSSLNPTTSWHRNRNYVFVIVLMYGLVFGIGFGLAAGIGAGMKGGLAEGVGGALAVGLGFGLGSGFRRSATFFAWMASAQLSRKWRTPVRMMDFLEDAYGRNVLRTVGPTYQFRHARLQDRLAAPVTARDGREPGPP